MRGEIIETEGHRVVEEYTRVGPGRERSFLFPAGPRGHGIPDLPRLDELRFDRGLSVPDRATGGVLIRFPDHRPGGARSGGPAALPDWYHLAVACIAAGLTLAMTMIAIWFCT